MQVGDVVTYVNPVGVSHNALVTAVWEGEYGSNVKPGLNLVFVEQDEAKRDDYGRQISRVSSIPHKDGMPAPGNYWWVEK